jgi:ABC-type branched-subunit amino acid transport system substrate-binding protein
MGALVAALAALAGCSSATEIQPGKSRVEVYVSMPLRGPSGRDGQDVEDAARMALADAHGAVGDLPVRGIYLDDTRGSGAKARWSMAQVGQNARRATEDSTSIAYIGDFDSSASRISIPITNAANLLQVSPASSAITLTRAYAGSQQLPELQKQADERTFGRVIPADEGKKATQPLPVSELPAAGQRFARAFRARYHRAAGPYAAYGYEAMAVVLDSIGRAGSDGARRQSVIDSFFSTTDRSSVLGTYSIDTVGDTSLLSG